MTLQDAPTAADAAPFPAKSSTVAAPGPLPVVQTAAWASLGHQAAHGLTVKIAIDMLQHVPAEAI